MPVSSNYDYWREREETQRQHNIEDLAEFNARLNAIYLQMIESATREIEAFYGRYAEAEGITVAEAKARVAKLEIEEYARKAAEYVRTHDLSDRANEEMRLYNATMKINRLELLKANIGLYMCGGFSEIEKEMGIRLDDATKAEFERLAGILGRTINNADKRSDSLVNASFQNATFSDRIWMYQDSLKDTLGGLLMSGMIQGKSPAELARGIRREFDVSRHQAERLMRTELCRVQTEAQKLSYQRNGYTKYIYLALGANPCDDCLDNDGKVFRVDEMSIAVNAPPMHPNCMCSTAPYYEGTIKDRVSIEENSNKAVGLQNEIPSGLQSVFGRSGLAVRTVHAKTGSFSIEDYLFKKSKEQWWRSKVKDTKPDYFKYASPGVGTLSRDKNLLEGRAREEITVQKLLHSLFGGDIRVLNKDLYPGTSPDYIWKDKLWELKTPESDKNYHKLIEKALKQITTNLIDYPPGGIVLDYTNLNLDLSTIIDTTIRRISIKEDTDIILSNDIDVIFLKNGEIVEILRYKKK